MKFKIGDKVRVLEFVDTNSTDDRSVIGRTGVIVKIDEHYKYPYQLKYDGESNTTCLFCDEELELVETNVRVSTELRDEVKWFAEEMEKKLKSRDEFYLNGWKKDKLNDLHFLMDFKAMQVKDFIFHYPNGYTDEQAIEFCADVANYAMMIADKIKKGDI